MTSAEFIAQWEGFRSQAYPDPGTGGEPITIGYGTTVYPDGRKVRLGDTCTPAQALEYLAHDVAASEAAVARLVTVPLTEGQRVALVSLVYNCGEGAFQKSTLLRLLNAGQYRQAAAEFPRWNRAGGRVLPGLVRRRAAEKLLFEAQIPSDPAASPSKTNHPSEPPVLPFVAAAIPALIEAAPALIRILGNGEQSEKNARAAEKVVEIARAVTQETTAEGAVTAIQADPAKAAEFREAVHLNMGELLGLVVQAVEAEDKSRDRATDRALALSAASGGKWLYLLGGVAITVVLASYAITAGVLFGPGTFSDETRAMLLGQVVILGFATVVGWMFGSNVSNRIRDARSEQ